MENNFHKVDIAPSVNYNSEVNLNLGEEKISADGYKIIPSIILYNPCTLNFEEILRENPPSFNYHIDYFVFIIHEIISVATRNKDKVEKYDGYVPIKKKYLQKTIHDYKKYINYLIENEVILCDNHYEPGVKSVGYKLGPRYTGCLVKQVLITKWSLIKSLKYLRKNYNVDMTQDLNPLKSWFSDSLSIDTEKCNNILKATYDREENNPEIKDPKLNMVLRSATVQKINDKYDLFIVDNSGYRLHTPLTQLMTDLRKFVSFDEKELCAVDIVNSQPYLATSFLSRESFLGNHMEDKIINPKLIHHNKYPIMVVDFISEIENENDVMNFKDIVSSGQFYEKFGEILEEKGVIHHKETDKRKVAKIITFETLFSPNRNISFSDSIKLFKEIFPNVYRVFKLIKKGRNNHNALAIALQRLEAELVLHKSALVINKLKPEIPIFTIHDSIITTVENIEFVKQHLKKVLEKSIGLPPSLKIEKWK